MRSCAVTQLGHERRAENIGIFYFFGSSAQLSTKKCNSQFAPDGAVALSTLLCQPKSASKEINLHAEINEHDVIAYSTTRAASPHC